MSASLISVGAVMRVGRVLLPAWRDMKGWESYWTAQALATGRGFSFPFDDPWPYDTIGTSGFHPSAWSDPLHSVVLACLIRLFGNYHQLAAAILNLALLLIVFGLTYRVAERLLSPAAGVAAVLVLAWNPGFSWSALQMNNTILAAAMVAGSALMLTRFLDGPNARRAAVLGLVLGLTMLTISGAQLFIPVAAVAIAASGWRSRGPAIARAAILLLVAALTISPWIVRNYMTFGVYVPGRTGLGNNAFLGVIVPAGMVMPEKLPVRVTPPWQSKSARSSVKEIVASPQRHDELYRFQSAYARAIAPEGYFTMDEAQRDAWLSQQTKAFALANPAFSIELGIAKLEAFVRAMGNFGALMCLLAVVGGILALDTPVVLTLAFWSASFAGPFALVIPFYDRYRAPIEPLLVVLAIFAVWRLSAIGSRRWRLRPEH